MKDFIKRLNENFEKKRSYLEESISESEQVKKPEKPFSVWDDYMEDEDEANIDRLFHAADQDELIKMGAFDNLNLEEAIEDIDINYMTISDLLSNMHENVPEEFLDTEIKFFKKLAKVFDTKLYDEILVAVDDGGYDPKYVFSDGLQMPELGETVIYYPEANMIAENKYGNLYLYFVTEDNLKKYFAMAKKFLTDFDLDSDTNIQEKMDKENLVKVEPKTEVNENVRSKELDQYLKELAKLDYESGHPFDPYDFDYFKHVCKDDGYDVTEDDFDRYFELLAEVRECQYDDNCDWFEDEE